MREEKDTDTLYIRHVHIQAFNGPDEALIVEALRNNHCLEISLVCEMDDKIVGHIAYSPVYHNNKVIGLGLAPVAVLPKYQRKGIGSALIKEGNKSVFKKGFKKIFVLGDPKYYSKFGFKPAKKYNYYCKFDPEGKYFMVSGRNIKSEKQETTVEYGKEFKEGKRSA
ncbi:MAG: N-acetyltransferase [Candidatus Omnitrophota bacterium]|nr:MAG: N-acetyltransferase [Candidatus Omnitrophota bacterium]